MEGLTRSLKYASFRAAKVIGVCLIMAFCFVFYFAFLDGSQFTVSSLLPRFPLMMLFIGNLMVMLYGMIDVATYTQLTLTYGCTRRDAAISTIYMHLLEILAFEVVMAVSCALIPVQWQVMEGKALCLLSLAIFLIGSGLALVTGILIQSFGKAAYIVFVIFASLGGGAVGGLVGFHGGMTVVMDVVLKLLNLRVMLGAGIAWYVLAAVIFWLFIRNMEVRV